VEHADGTISDDRLEEIRSVEATVSKYVNESFANVSLRIAIPPPDMKTILSSAKIYANDGVEGLIDSKGDGLRRAIVFSILRSFVELKAKPHRTDERVPTEAMIGANAVGFDAEVDPNHPPHLPAEVRNPESVASPPSYILMFEEPELFLHPKAQHILFDALRVFALEHQVLVTTHSPMFLGPGATDSFVKLRKVTDSAIASKPFTKVQTVDVSMLSAKDQFQIICFENNNAAFFASTVVLVEGDSDYLLMPHIAKTLNPLWDVSRTPVLFVRISGKGNIRRYREFFKNFDVRVPVIADLDFLVQGFEHIAHDEPMRLLRDQLLVRVDSLIEVDGIGASNKEAKDARDSGELKGLWKVVKQRTAELLEGNCTADELNAAVERFYAWQRKTDRNSVLKNGTDLQMTRDKHQLLEMLRAVDVFVLERGAIEEYYPSSITGADKPSKAQDFCAKVATAHAAKECCGSQNFERGGVSMNENEFTLIFGGIFS
jgi:putative ATP-dependent endonuclease of OLD family